MQNVSVVKVNASQEAMLVDGEQKLRIRRLDVLRSEANRILVKNGLAKGDRVAVAGLQTAV